MNSATRQLVIGRAANRCECCRVPQSALSTPLQVEHVIARQHFGGDNLENLALACDQCNVHKGPNLSAVDPVTGTVVQLFNPRHDQWEQHFELSKAGEISARTPSGRATARLLQMNTRARVVLRAILLARTEI